MVRAEAELSRVDTVQLIEAELVRLIPRFDAAQKKGISETLILDSDDVEWFVFIRPEFPGEAPTRSIYFFDINREEPAQAIVWQDQATPATFKATDYSFRFDDRDLLMGFDISDDCEWQLVGPDNPLALTLLRSLPDRRPG